MTISSEQTDSKNHYQDYLDSFDRLHKQSVFGLSASQKQEVLMPALNALHCHHQNQCEPYLQITHTSSDAHCSAIESFDFLAVRLFKLMSLSSVDAGEVFKTLQSSGTTSQVTAKVTLDHATSQRQSKVLVAIMQQVLGKARLPMLIIDAQKNVRDRSKFNARAAGIQGLAFFGRNHTYALDDNLRPDWQAIEQFCQQHEGQPKLVFGFTFMVWQYFLQALKARNASVDLSSGILIHSGGWKKLASEKVDNQTFKQCISETMGITKVHNFYGMAEQVGSVFMECSQGFLHAPSYADIILRDPYDLSPVLPEKSSNNQKVGLIQVLSSVPSSYPGHSILTEDLGILHGEDDCLCGWKGKYFTVQGRLPKAEIRGCSDTHSEKQ